jgi:hypothetical protein
MSLVYRNNPGLIAKKIADLENEANALRDKINKALTVLPKKP